MHLFSLFPEKNFQEFCEIHLTSLISSFCSQNQNAIFVDYDEKIPRISPLKHEKRERSRWLLSLFPDKSGWD